MNVRLVWFIPGLLAGAILLGGCGPSADDMSNQVRLPKQSPYAAAGAAHMAGAQVGKGAASPPPGMAGPKSGGAPGAAGETATPGGAPGAK